MKFANNGGAADRGRQLPIKPLKTGSAQQTFEGGSIVSYTQFSPRARTLSLLLQIFFSFSIQLIST